MSAILSDPFPHAYNVTVGGQVLAPQADALMLMGIAATTATITIVTVNGETVTFTFSQTSLPACPYIYLPVQCKQVVSSTGIASIVALYH